MLHHAGAQFVATCALLLIGVSANSLVRVMPGKVECFFEVVTDPRFKTMEVAYQVTEGGDIGFELLFEDEILKQDEFKQHGTHK